ncbi:MAG: hypothetical protein QX196_14350 [Methylococcaceae bacterium]
MDYNLVAKITVPRTDNETKTGTAYPVGANLLLTARHVIEFNERDKTKSVTVEWEDFSAVVKIESQDIDFVFDGGKKLDVILLRCPIPPGIAKAVSSDILGEEKIGSGKKWKTAGFPKVNGFNRKGVIGTYGVDADRSTIDLTLDDTTEAKNEWGGMSGAPVFCIETHKLQAIIIIHNQGMKKQLIGVSVPYLMKQPEFRKALGLPDSSDKQKQPIKDPINKYEGLTAIEWCSRLDRNNGWDSQMNKRIDRQKRKAIAFVIAGANKEWPRALPMSLKIKYDISNARLPDTYNIFIPNDCKDDDKPLKNIWFKFLDAFNDRNSTDDLNDNLTICDIKEKLADQLSQSSTPVCFNLSLDSISCNKKNLITLIIQGWESLKLDNSDLNHFLFVIYSDENINPGFFAPFLKILGIPSKDKIEEWRLDITNKVDNDIVAHQLKSPALNDIIQWIDRYNLESDTTKTPNFRKAIEGKAGKMPHYDIRTLYTKHFSST